MTMKVCAALMIFGSLLQFYYNPITPLVDAAPAKCEQKKCPPGCETVDSSSAKPCPDCDCRNLIKKKEKENVCDAPKCPSGCVSQLVRTGPCHECRCKDETKEKGSQYLSRLKREETDIDECKKNYPCSQHCHKTHGSYKCTCEEGYISTNDGITCKANSSVNPKLMFSIEYNIFQMDLDGRNIKLLATNLKVSWGLDFDWMENCTYFNDYTMDKVSNIKRICLDTPEPQIIRTGSVYGLAVDWIGRNLYWNDGQKQTIEVSTLDGKFHKVLISKGIEKPRAMIVDPFRGYMYWTDKGRRPYIGKAGMDGTNFTRLITRPLGWPNALTIDYVTKELFWSDAYHECIAVSDLDGLNRKILVKKGQFSQVPYIYSLTVFEDQLYWSNGNTKSIERCHKYHCDNYSTISTANHRPVSLTVVHPYRQTMLKTANPCTIAGCKYMCLLKPGGDATCLCPEYHILEDDNVSCRCNSTTSQFLCKSTYKCIPREWYCDTEDDCGDKSDEPAECEPFRCNTGQFQCDNFKCIPTQEKCDGYSQCGDMSDEQDCDECKKNYPCSQHCHSMLGSFKCSCEEGYLSENDAITCKANSSVNPKLIFSNQFNIYQMDLDGRNTKLLARDLESSYGLDFDWIENCIYFSDNALTNIGSSSIKRMCLDTHESQIIQTGYVRRCEGLAVDWIGRNLYWTDRKKQTIEVSTLDGKFRKVLFKEGLDIPRAIVVDPFRGYMYWTDWGQNPYIGKAGMDGSEFSKLITRSLGWPNALTIDYVTKEIFWVDAKKEYMAVSDLDGLNRRILVKKGQFSPVPQFYSITVFEDQLCWSNGNTNGIERCHKYHCDNSSTISTTNYKPVAVKVIHPYRQTLLKAANPCTTAGCKFLCLLKPGGDATCSCPENQVLDDDNVSCRSNCRTSQFLCKSNYECIPREWYCDTQEDCEDESDEPAGCKPFRCHAEQFQCDNFNCIPTQEKCDGYSQCGDMSDEQDCDQCKKNYPCSQHCHNTHGSHKCTCEEGYFSTNDGITCKASSSINPKLIFSNEFNIFRMDLDGRNTKLLARNLERSWGLDFDWVENCIYFSDNSVTNIGTSSIKRMCLQSPELQLIQAGYIGTCEGLAVDWIGRNLYWSDRKKKSIEVCTLYGKFRKVIIRKGLKKARAIVVDPFRGYMYWTDWGHNPYIGKAGMDGSEFSKLITGNLGWPNALTIDYVTKELFWADTKEEYIAVADLDGLNRRILVKKGQFSEVPYISAITVFEDQLYWSNGNTKSIERCHKYHCDNYSTISTTLYKPVAVKVIHPYRQTLLQTENPCTTTGCKFLCILVPGGGAKCSCPEDHFLEVDNVSCRSNCTNSQFLCKSTYKCIPREWYCDTKDDCGDKSDEPAECKRFPCNAGQFQCDNLKCIPTQEKCDGYSQCGDMSDEENCEIDECRKNYPCSQHCHITLGSYKCSCEEGYFSTNNGITCKANSSVQPKLVFSNEYNIFQMNLDGRNTKQLADNIFSAIGVDFDSTENCIYFSENAVTNISTSSIKRMCLDAPKPQIIQTGNISTCEGLAVDWVGRNLYWSDTKEKTIEVSTLDGKFRKVLFKEELDKPGAIIVDPSRGYMYWTDWGDKPHIGKAGMDGSEFSKLITKSLGWPHALTIDYVTKEIFWADAKEEYIAVADLDGLNRKILMKKGQFAEVAHIASLSIFEDQLYWSNWNKNSIETCHKYHCINFSTIGTTNYKPMGLQVVHPYKQAPLQTPNPCTTAGCKVLCLLKPGGGATCACPENHILEVDNISCRSNCTISQFQCKSTYKCIPRQWYCNTEDDCGDKSDESAECKPFRCNAGQFQCGNFNCIPTQEKCDGYSQCGDMSDEQDCDEYSCPQEEKFFKCLRNGTTQAYCITRHRRCDGTIDCIGEEDEIKCDYSKEIQHPRWCLTQKCPEGCKIDVDVKPCPKCNCSGENEDTDECRKRFPCSQNCSNTNGSYKCSCEVGYSSINDGITCKANSSVKPKLIYASDSYIFQSELYGIHIKKVVNNLTNTVGLDFDWIENCIYWSDNNNNGSFIKRMCTGTPGHQLLHTEYTKLVEGLAVDWIGRNLYWTDKETNTIEVSALNGRFRKVLISKELQEPRAIALYPFGGYMYWTDWGDNPYIAKAGMDGTEFTKLITKSLGWPNALTIDYVTREMFWADAKFDYIGVADLDGLNRRIVIMGVREVFSLSVFEDRLYWSDWNTKTIERCHKYHCIESETIATTEHQSMAVQVFHPYKKPPLKTENPCTTAGCSTLCLLKPGGRAICACPESFTLGDDNVSCRNNCLSSEFVCTSTYKCIPSTWYCDNQDDCGDKSDEPEDCPPFECNQGQFQCNIFKCIPQNQICDGESQCRDMSDEKNCDVYPCLSGQFKCPRNGNTQARCISLLSLCDDIKDCIGGEDELNCGGGLKKSLSCSPPICSHGCTVDVYAKPCPACKCNKKNEKKERCKTIKWVHSFQEKNLNTANEKDCDEDEFDDYDDEDMSSRARVPCFPVTCRDGCKINIRAKPCPVCTCRDENEKKDICKTIKWANVYQEKNLNTRIEANCDDYGYDDYVDDDDDTLVVNICKKSAHQICAKPQLKVPVTVKQLIDFCESRKLQNFFECLRDYDSSCIDRKHGLVVLTPGEFESVQSLIEDICNTDSLSYAIVSQHLNCLKESIMNYSTTCKTRDRLIKTYNNQKDSSGDTDSTKKYLAGKCMYVSYDTACLLSYISGKCGNILEVAVRDIIHRAYYIRDFCSLETFIHLSKEVETLDVDTNQKNILSEIFRELTWK